MSTLTIRNAATRRELAHTPAGEALERWLLLSHGKAPTAESRVTLTLSVSHVYPAVSRGAVQARQRRAKARRQRKHTR